MRPLLSDQIQEFIDWLEKYTDYGKDHMSVIHKKLIECMTPVDNRLDRLSGRIVPPDWHGPPEDY